MAFPTTRWTLIQQAAAAPTLESRAALEDLCQQYSGPVLGFVRRRMPNEQKAEDLTQDFFALLLNGKLLERANPDKGKFRTFLLNAVTNFLADAHDKSNAQKRGGGVVHVSLTDTIICEAKTNLTPEVEFDANWGRAMLQRSIDRLQSEYSGERVALFDALKNHLSGSPGVAGRDVSRSLNMNEGAVRVALHRMRQRLGQLIREEVAETVPTSADIDDELMNLRRILENS